MSSYVDREDDVLMYYPSCQAAIDAAESKGYTPARLTDADTDSPVYLRHSEGRERKPKCLTVLTAKQIEKMGSASCVNVDQWGEYQYGPRLVKSVKRAGHWYLQFTK